MLDPTACQRWDCCSCISPGPTSSKAADVFLVGMCPEGPYTPHTQLAVQIIEHTQEHSTSGLILLTSLAEQDPWPLVRTVNIHSHTRWCLQQLSPGTCLAQGLALGPRLSSCWCLDTGWPSRVLFGLPLMPLSICATLWVCRSAFRTSALFLRYKEN